MSRKKFENGYAPRWGIPTPAQNNDYEGMGQFLCTDGAHYETVHIMRRCSAPSLRSPVAMTTVIIDTSGNSDAPRCGIPTPAQNNDYEGMGQSPCRDGALHRLESKKSARCALKFLIALQRLAVLQNGHQRQSQIGKSITH